jgi:DNA modification methylase
MDGVILNADCLVALKAMPDACVDMCMTSPPYYMQRNYNVEGQLGWEPTPQEYIARLCDIFDEVKRVLKPTGTCWVNLGDKHDDGCLCQLPSRVAIEMTKRGWILRNEIIWHKPNCSPSPVKDRFTPDFEKIFFFTKTTKYHFEQQFEPLAESSKLRAKYAWHCDRANNGTGVHVEKMGKRFCNPKGRNKRCVWSIPTSSFKGPHPAKYPEELCDTPIKAGCPVNGIVLDPFAGVGSTLLAAKRLGRRYVGCELNPEYCRMIEERLKDDAPLPPIASTPQESVTRLGFPE